MEMNKPFKIFANCIAVKGAVRSTICDIRRQDVKLIPNDLYEILNLHEEKTIEEIKAVYNNKFDKTIEEYFEFLLEEEFIFFTENPEFFPKLSMQWDDPTIITNCIVDYNNKSEYSINDVIAQLDNLNCKHLEFRFYDVVELNFLEKILEYVEQIKSSIVSIEILLPFISNESEIYIKEILLRYNRVQIIRVFNASKNNVIGPIINTSGYIIYSTKTIKNDTYCGFISKDFFVINIPLFTESQNHNSCLNRKMAIDVNGNIKNCPSMAQSFGNINDATLENALSHKDFKKYWNITKDQIETCKDCEFRHVCTDCRA